MSKESDISEKINIKDLFKFLLAYPDVTDVRSAEKCQKHVKWKASIMIVVFGIVCIIVGFGLYCGFHTVLQTLVNAACRLTRRDVPKEVFYFGFLLLMLVPMVYAIGVMKSWKIKSDDLAIMETLISLPHRMYSGECTECQKYELDRNLVLRFLQEFVESKSHDEFAKFLYLFSKDHTNAELITEDLNKVYEDYKGCLSCTLLCVFSNPQYYTHSEKEGLSEYFLNFDTDLEKEINRVFCVSAIRNLKKYKSKQNKQKVCIINNLNRNSGRKCSCNDSNNSNCPIYLEYKAKCILMMHYIILNIVTGVKVRVVHDKERNDSVPYVDYVIGIYMDTEKDSYSVQKLYVSFEDPKYVKYNENKVLIWKDRLLLSVLKRDFNKRWHRGMAQDATKQVYDIIGDYSSIKVFLDSLNIRKESQWVKEILIEAFASIDNLDSIKDRIQISGYKDLKNKILNVLN